MQTAGEESSNSGIPIVRRSTASSLLAKFLPNQRVEHKMAAVKTSLRSKPSISYAESKGSTTPTPPTLEKSCEEFVSAEAMEDSEDELIKYVDRKSSGRHSLRPRSSLTLSTKAAENGDRRPSKATDHAARTFRAKSFYGEVDELSLPLVSERVAVRNQIATTTAAKRNKFFLEKKDYFLPLLPPNNFVKKLAEKYEALSPQERARVPATIPYEEIETQPKGIVAKMKPYQLSGLSFLVYLHRNGLSGILGDEMGLGKTLQTLSLIQYLKENEPKAGGQIRPFLIVCPLSVLSSWMAEAKKWAPGLKILRFHGPVKERDRLKKIALGEIDIYGNITSKQKAKLKTRKTASGKPLISLDSDSDDKDEDIGVDVVVTTYESYLAEQIWFKRAFVWRYVVLDEGHKIKNDLSLISQALQGLQAEYRLILTGTPLQNNLTELWALLHWLYPDIFTEQSNDLFRTSFDLTRGLYSDTVLDNSRHLLELMMLRRMKNSPGVDLNLPPKTEVLLFVPLSPMQRFWYTRLITRADQGLLDELFRGAKDKEHAALKSEAEVKADLIKKDADALKTMSKNMVMGSDEWKESREILARTIEREQEDRDGAIKTSGWQKLMNLLMQLRKVCNHPYQIPNAEPDPYELGDHITRASGKFIVLEKLISELVIKQRKKILIFSGFTKMLDLVEEFLLLNGGDGTKFKSVRLDGGTGRARRNLGIRMFNDTSSDYRVMLISTRAGGLGINLATASDVVLLDQDWNPQITLQAEARAHRIGQANPVTVYKLVSQGTVEEQMMGRIQKKLYLSAKVTESMQDIHTKSGGEKVKKQRGGRTAAAGDDMPQLNAGQLMALVRRGASALSRPEVDVNEMLSWDWETTVSKCKDQPADISVKKDAIPSAVVDQEAEKKWLSEMEKVESYIFEGKKLERGRGATSTKDIASEWNRADRRIGKNTTVMVDGFAINKESMNCKDWEAVPTMAGKDPRLAEPKRAKKEPIISQSHCQVCLDGGELHCCRLCPRAYHFGCLDREFKAKTKGWTFHCPQHQCADCEQKTTDAGGMLYRCRWCERAFCEDCLDWEKTQLIGETLVEYDLLGYQAVDQAFYIQCHACTSHFEENPADQAMCERMAIEVEQEYERVFSAVAKSNAHANDDAETEVNGNTATSYYDATSFSSRAGSIGLTDAATIETTGANTPIILDEDVEFLSVGKSKKRKATSGPESRLKASFKREELDSSLLINITGSSKRTKLDSPTVSVSMSIVDTITPASTSGSARKSTLKKKLEMDATMTGSSPESTRRSTLQKKLDIDALTNGSPRSTRKTNQRRN